MDDVNGIYAKQLVKNRPTYWKRIPCILHNKYFFLLPFSTLFLSLTISLSFISLGLRVQQTFRDGNTVLVFRLCLCAFFIAIQFSRREFYFSLSFIHSCPFDWTLLILLCCVWAYACVCVCVRVCVRERKRLRNKCGV